MTTRQYLHEKDKEAYNANLSKPRNYKGCTINLIGEYHKVYAIDCPWFNGYENGINPLKDSYETLKAAKAAIDKVKARIAG